MFRFTYFAVVALLAAAIGAASASGGIRPDDRATHGPGAVATTTSPVRPDDRPNHGPGPFTAGGSTEPVRPDDRAWRGVTPAPTVEVVASASPPSDEFDWADAGIGAGAAFGLGLLLVGGSALALRRQRVVAPS